MLLACVDVSNILNGCGQSFTSSCYNKANGPLAFISALFLFPRLTSPCGLIFCLHRHVDLFNNTAKVLLLPSAMNNNWRIADAPCHPYECVAMLVNVFVRRSWRVFAPEPTTAVLWPFFSSQRQRGAPVYKAKKESSSPLCRSSTSVIYSLGPYLKSLSAFTLTSIFSSFSF